MIPDKHPPRVLDFAIVALLIVIPQSSFLWMASSEFGGSPSLRAFYFTLPAVLVAIKLTRPVHRRKSGVDPIILVLWLGVLMQGLIMGLIHTEHAANTLSTYGQSLYWLFLVAVFLASMRTTGMVAVFELVRRYFVVVSVTAWVFAGLFLIFGGRLPHSSAFMPGAEGDPTVFADNYYFTLAYSSHSFLGKSIPRFAFFYREPRVLGTHLVIGIILQVGYVKSRWPRWQPKDRLRGLLVLGLVVGALFWAHSFNGYLFGIAVALGLLSIEVGRVRFWKNFRAIHTGIMGAGVVATAVAFAIIGQRSDLVAFVEDAVSQNYVEAATPTGSSLADFIGKEPQFIVSYIATFLSAPRAVMQFPMGVGIMNLDSERFGKEFGIATNGGATLLQFFVLNAGVVGLAAFLIIAWRFFGRLGWLVVKTNAPEIRYAAFLCAFLFVISSIFYDVISVSAFGPLLFGSIMGVDPKA